MAFINYLERIFLYTTLKCIPEPLEMVLLTKPEMEFHEQLLNDILEQH
jgi:hypothetical protein